MEFFIDRLPLYLSGAGTTLTITLLGAVLAFVLAMVIGTLGTLRNPAARGFATFYTETFRGVAALILMYWMAFAVPQITPYEIDPMFAAVLALGLNIGAYGAEVVRAAINAVPKAQIEATVALSMSWWRRMRSVVLPQAWAQMLPTFGNLIIELMKATAIVSLIGVADLTRIAQEQRTATGETILAFSGALVVYFVIAQVLILGMRLLERRANRRLGRPTESGFLALLRPPPVNAIGGGRQ
ncbi:ectoine/hydroxyectoine ABC transporter permease subunit EhuC [Thermobifida halotolerans]|uniref:Ectoine/hydroxyectoine ABC transporter permease subunit EhuC n=1 Tax=Thermobifida halotolerans TaxID=483545 RepID=A0A399FYD9_9ACTN|nr:ectoine/hydroxyectoine ABC transporter permease subunit EhuC [Thermobifida halotolerans]UOE19371.1 ectoine/hydroxyectoine ABC transporter permease subunit EhuC [Thermobifida halotolerans]